MTLLSCQYGARSTQLSGMMLTVFVDMALDLGQRVTHSWVRAK